jgi:hypothetical protein
MDGYDLLALSLQHKNSHVRTSIRTWLFLAPLGVEIKPPVQLGEDKKSFSKRKPPGYNSKRFGERITE